VAELTQAIVHGVDQGGTTMKEGHQLTCPKCSGEGTVVGMGPPIGYGRGVPIEQCPTCRGKREVGVERISLWCVPCKGHGVIGKFNVFAGPSAKVGLPQCPRCEGKGYTYDLDRTGPVDSTNCLEIAKGVHMFLRKIAAELPAVATQTRMDMSIHQPSIKSMLGRR
jgi:hypothetical protein